MRKHLSKLGFAITSLALSMPSFAIINGTLTNGSDFANVGAIIGVDGTTVASRHCTGQVINNNYQGDKVVVLTVGHCVNDLKDTTIKISFDRDTGGDANQANYVAATSFAIAPDFKVISAQLDRYRNDIAVIFFNKTDIAAKWPGLTNAPVAVAGALDTLGKSLAGTPVSVAGYGLVALSDKSADRFSHRRVTIPPMVARKITNDNLYSSMNPRSTVGTCTGDGGAGEYVNGSIVSMVMSGDFACKSTDQSFRVDTAAAHGFLNQYLP